MSLHIFRRTSGKILRTNDFGCEKSELKEYFYKNDLKYMRIENGIFFGR